MYKIKYENNQINSHIKLSLKELDLIAQALYTLKIKTGVYIDIYGNGISVYPNHLKILVEELREIKRNTKIDELVAFIQNAIDSNEVLLFDGL